MTTHTKVTKVATKGKRDKKVHMTTQNIFRSK
jgi:hypothetical protein